MTTTAQSSADAIPQKPATPSGKPASAMTQRVINWLQSAIVWTVGITVFLLPFVYGTWTVEYLRYNKLTVLLISTIIVVILWAIKIAMEKEIRFKRTVLDMPILLLGAAGIVASLMSAIPSQSFWGTFPNFEDSLLLTLMGIINFYALINHVRGARDWLMVIGMVLTSGAILALITVLQYFGVFLLPFGDLAANRLFSPFGTVFQAGIYLAVLAPLASGFLIGSVSNKRWVLTGLVGTLLLLSLIVFGVIDYWPVWVIAAFGMLVSSLVSLAIVDENKRIWAILPVALLLLSVIIFKVPGVRSAVPGVDLTPEKPITLSLGASFEIAQQTFSESAFAGVGQGNYGYAYKLLKPADFNQRADWLLNYNRPSNQLFLTFTTMGLVGLGALIFLLYRLVTLLATAIISHTGEEEADPAVVGLFVSLAAFVLVLFIGWLTIPLQMLFWVLLVLAIYIGFQPEVSGILGEKVFSMKMATDGGAQQRDFLSAGAAVLASVAVLYVGFLAVSTYMVDVRLRDAINYGNDGDTARSLQAQNDVVTNKHVTDYQLRGVAIVLHNQGVAAEVAAAEDTEQRTADIERKRAFFREAVRFARQAIGMNPNASENQEVLLGIYSTLFDYGINRIDQVPMQTLMAELQQNLGRLTPSDVTWRIRMANYYLGAEDYTTALNLLGQANFYKSNLVDIHYLAALAYGESGDYQNAIVEANIALRSLDPDHPWTTELTDRVEEWNAAIEDGDTPTGATGSGAATSSAGSATTPTTNP